MKRTEVRFETGSILTKEILQEMADFPKIAVETYYDGYQDGILYGLTWQEIGEGKHRISTGAMKWKGKIYFLREPIEVENLDVNDKFVIDGYYWLVFSPMEKISLGKNTTEIAHIMELSPRLDRKEREQLREDEYCYARLLYNGENEGFELQKEPACGLWSSAGKYAYCISPDYMGEVVERLETKKEKHPLDYEILGILYQRQPISVDLMLLYIREYALEADEPYDEGIAEHPNELFEEFYRVLELLSQKKIYLKEEAKEEENAVWEEDEGGRMW